MPTFPSPEWLEAFKAVIDASDSYKQDSKDWEGDIAIVIEPEPDKGVPDEIWGWFDLWHGECREAKIVTVDEGERATYIIRAPYSLWKEVLIGRLDPIKGMIQGKLRLTGDLPTLTQRVEAASALVSLAASIPTTFPDE